jgi:hypothetical protein
MYQAMNEYNEIDREGPGIANDYQTHIPHLRDIAPSTKKYATDFLQLRDKWNYYREQTQYVFGDNPDNSGPNSLTNAVEAYAMFLERWGSVKNKDSQDVYYLLSSGKNDFTTRIRTFSNWHQGCRQRLEQMKASIQLAPSSSLQIPRTVPAVQMLM